MLRVWLPLNGDLHNQGCSDLVFTNENTTNITLDNNGKIGTCYKKATAAAAGRIVSDSNILLDGSLSMCCWAKVTATKQDTAQGLITNHAIGTKSGFGINVKQISTTDYRICCSTGNGSSRTYYDYYGTTNIKDSWHHLALTYNDITHEFQLWVDGQVEKTQTYTNKAVENKIMIFAWAVDNTTSTYYPACMLNDVRIYDHCLSAAEVREISQGLVLHYKLDNNGHKNLFTSDADRVMTIAAGGTSVYSANTYIDPIIKNNGIFKEGTQYTITYDYVINSITSSTSVYVYSQLNAARCSPLIAQTWMRNGATGSGHVVETFTVTEEQANYSNTFRVRWRINGGTEGDSITLKNIRLYLGTAEEINYISDSSGYNHNGTIIGDLTTTNDSPRYSLCSLSPNQTSYITTPNNIFTLNTEEFTYSCWIKTTTANQNCIFANRTATDNLGITMFINNNTPKNILFDAGAARQTKANPLELNTWYHLAFTYKKGDKKCIYVNGTLVASASSPNSPTANNSTLFFGAAQTGTGGVQGSMSDIRIYMTPLDADAIRQLYEVGAKIDNKQNLHAFELVENNSKIQITKQGQIKCNELEENEKTKFYQADQIIETNEIIEL